MFIQKEKEIVDLLKKCLMRRFIKYRKYNFFRKHEIKKIIQKQFLKMKYLLKEKLQTIEKLEGKIVKFSLKC